ncbi:MAG: hypothetical protein ACFCGT_16290 [Sandaracinaceae bacterium]
MSIAQEALTAASEYLRRNPAEVSRAVVNLLGLRAGLPVDALRWLLDKAAEGGRVRDPVLVEAPPGLRLTASVDLMKTPVRASAAIFIDRIHLSADAIRMEVRLEDIWMEVIGESKTAVAALLRSGNLDLSKPGELAKHMDLPPVIVEARDNRLVVDLMKEPRIGNSEAVHRALALVTPLVTMAGIEADDEHLTVVFRPFPKGIIPAVGAVRTHLLKPGIQRVRALIPSIL